MNKLQLPICMSHSGKSLLANLSGELSQLERRDWELWLIISMTGALVTAALVAIVFPASFLQGQSLHFQVTASRPLVAGLIVLLAILNTYLLSKRFEVRRLRERLISSTVQQHLIEQQSFTDPLTEIYNRRSLTDLAQRFMNRARRRQEPLTVLMIDVDRFKEINTKCGHLTGDLVLWEIAALLKMSVRGSDALVRYGGDEFLILLADSDEAGANAVTARINAKLVEWNGSSTLKGISLSLSIGTREWRDGETLDELLNSADQRMYEHKHSTEEVR